MGSRNLAAGEAAGSIQAVVRTAEEEAVRNEAAEDVSTVGVAVSTAGVAVDSMAAEAVLMWLQRRRQQQQQPLSPC